MRSWRNRTASWAPISAASTPFSSASAVPLHYVSRLPGRGRKHAKRAPAKTGHHSTCPAIPRIRPPTGPSRRAATSELAKSASGRGGVRQRHPVEIGVKMPSWRSVLERLDRLVGIAVCMRLDEPG